MMIYPTVSRGAAIVAFVACSCSASAAAGAPSKASCTVPNTDAAMRTNYPAEWPRIAELQNASGIAVIRIDVSETGVARNPVVVKSSGNTLLDEAAKQSTMSQRYAPEIEDCANVSGSYLVDVHFTK